MSSGRIEREPAQLRHSAPRLRQVTDVMAGWGLFCWFVTMFVRGREVGPWELAGFVVALIAVAGWMRESWEGDEMKETLEQAVSRIEEKNG